MRWMLKGLFAAFACAAAQPVVAQSTAEDGEAQNEEPEATSYTVTRAGRGARERYPRGSRIDDLNKVCLADEDERVALIRRGGRRIVLKGPGCGVVHLSHQGRPEHEVAGIVAGAIHSVIAPLLAGEADDDENGEQAPTASEQEVGRPGDAETEQGPPPDPE